MNGSRNTKTRHGWLEKRGKVYLARWASGGKLFARSTGETTERAALAKMAEIVAPYRLESEAATVQALADKADTLGTESIRARTPNPPLKPTDAFTEAWQAAAQNAGTLPRSEQGRNQYVAAWKLFAEWMQANHSEAVSLRDVRPEHAARYMKHFLSDGKTGRTWNAHRTALRSMVNTLTPEEARGVFPNPFGANKALKAPEVTEGRDTLTLEELRAVCSSAQGELRLLLAFGVFCGCRLGDACRLQWQNIDFRKKSLRYVPAKTAGKSEVGVVEVGLNPELLALLRETTQERREGYIMPDFARRYVDPGPWSVSSEVQDHLAKCGLQTNRKRIAGGKRAVCAFGFHSLRKCFVTYLQAAGVSSTLTMLLAGHRNEGVHSRYVRPGSAQLQEIAAKQPTLLSTGEKPDREPLPEWAAKLVRALTPANLKETQDELLGELNME